MASSLLLPTPAAGARACGRAGGRAVSAPPASPAVARSALAIGNPIPTHPPRTSRSSAAATRAHFHPGRPAGLLPRGSNTRGGRCRAVEEEAEFKVPPASEDGFYWASSLSIRDDLTKCLVECKVDIDNQIANQETKPDLAVVFVSSRFQEDYDIIIPFLQREFPSLKAIIGCSGYGVAGSLYESPGQRRAAEVELRPALSIAVGGLPGVKLKTFQLSSNNLPDGDSPPLAWAQRIKVPLAGGETRPTEVPHFMLMPSPIMPRMMEALSGLDYAYPASTKIGGLPASGRQTEPWIAFAATKTGIDIDEDYDVVGKWEMQETDTELIGLSMRGGIEVEPLVAQGCRQVGERFTITGCGAGSSGVMTEITLESGEVASPLLYLMDLSNGMEAGERQSMEMSCMVAIDRAPLKAEPATGDFLVRPIGQVDAVTGAMQVGALLTKGMRGKFVVRDRRGALEDLESSAAAYKRAELLRSLPSPEEGARRMVTRPFGAVMFSCAGRGHELFEEDAVDSNVFLKYCPVPLAGAHVNGEIGPTGEATHLHQFTAVYGILRGVPYGEMLADVMRQAEEAEEAAARGAGGGAPGGDAPGGGEEVPPAAPGPEA